MQGFGRTPRMPAGIEALEPAPPYPICPGRKGRSPLPALPSGGIRRTPSSGATPLKNVVRIFNSAVMPYGDSFIGVFRGGAAPIETSEGWLLFYHGVTGTCNGYVYSIGGAILDIDDPSIVKYFTFSA